jgi:signal transduction histidine kinase
VYVNADEARLRQVLMILLDNALKHTPDCGAITVRVAPVRDRAALEVVDTGPGIDPRDLPHLFDRFYRADRARTSEGTGLGLAIARSIVFAHHGDITAANAPNGGAIFTVSLPMSA